jgi:hypothetical protein
MKMKKWDLSNFNKFIATLKQHPCSYPHWKKMSLIGSMVLRRPRIFGTLFEEPVKKAKMQLVEGQLDKFVMLDNESSQDMYNRLKKHVNEVRAYGSRRWGD